MANPSKFVSVNLNKSYGKPHTPSSTSSLSSSTSPALSHGSRARPGSGGGGMVVLSRPRSSGSAGQKTGSRLSVPPPLNLPSLRKEHERFDPSSTGTSAGAGNTGHGSGQGTHAMGWTKPGLSMAFQGKEASKDQVGRLGTADQRVFPPGSQQALALAAAAGSGKALTMVEKAVVLRGEDFPSLLATFTSPQKQKDALNPKLKQKQRQAGEEEPSDRPSLESPFDMRPQLRSSRLVDVKRLEGSGGLNHLSGSVEHLQKQNAAFPSPLPLVRLAHTSDWADDERDTGDGIQGRDKERRFSRADSFPSFDHSDGRRLRDSESGSVPSREIFRGDSFGRDITSSNNERQDASSWRAQPHSRTGFASREVGVERGGVNGGAFGLNRETSKEIYKRGHSPYADRVRNGFANGAQDSRYTRREVVYGQNMSNGNYNSETRSADQNMRGHYSDLSKNRYKGDHQQNSTASKAPFSPRNKGFSVDDPLLNFGREKHLFSSNRKLYLDDAGLDSRDPFSLMGDANLKVFKRKKEVQKQVDFHDPVRESFEAELERVQRMQEQERQRVLEEQTRALELARREEEERDRLVREEEERRRRLEEEAREAAWRTEQERLEAVKRAEEQKLAREEEKRRVLMEEERRKVAARQKLLELEARIAQRQAESATKDDRFPAAPAGELVSGAVKVSDVPRVADVRDWEDSERMVDHISYSASPDSSSMNRFSETGSRPHSSRDENPSFMERGKHTNSWKRDAFDSGNNSTALPHDHESGYRSPRRDLFGTGRMFPRKEFYGAPGSGGIGPSSKGGTTEPPQMLDDFRNSRGSRWNGAGDSDYFTRNSDIDAEFIENDRFDDAGWGHNQTRSSPHALCAERCLHTSDVDGFASFGRSRHSLRQPRVLPPPAMPSVHKSSIRPEPVHPSSSVFLKRETGYETSGKDDVETFETEYESEFQDELQQRGILASPENDTISPEQKEEKNTPRCDSQSSLSVSSPPSSPTHLSHDDLDDSGDTPSLPASVDGEGLALPNQEHVVSALEIGKTNFVTASDLVSPRENDEWAVENDQEIQEQEVYDEEDGYQDEDEVHEDNNVNLDLQEFEDLHTVMQNVNGEMDQLVLGFDEGVEVRIPSTSEFDGISENGEKEISKVTAPNGATQELGPSDEISGNAGHNPEVKNTSTKEMEGISSNIVNETEKALRDLALQPVASTSDTVDITDTSGSSGMQTQQTMPSAFNVPLPLTPSAQPIFPSVSAVPSQAEAPVKLQFGLFSGPSLIPSPVPAIQIGSIQMPLHLHPPVGPSLTQVHHSQSPYFQFGQLTYTTPVSQGVLPLAPHSVPFAQSTAPTHYSLNQQSGGSLHCQTNQDSSTQIASSPMNNQSGFAAMPLNLFQEKSKCKEPNALLDIPRSEVLSSRDKVVSSKSNYLVEQQGTLDVTLKNSGTYVNNSRESQGHPPAEPVSSQFSSRDKVASGLKSSRTVPGSRGKRYVYTVRNSGSRSFSGSETSHAVYADSGGIQRRARRNIRRTEFRVRENDRRRTEGMDSSNYAGQNEKNFNGRVPGMSVRNGAKRDPNLFKSSKLMIEPDRLTAGASSSQVANSDGKLGKLPAKAAASKRFLSSMDNTHSVEEGFKRNGNTDDDVDAPLQCGVVRVFKQPGIEAPSDEDDFIEVRSKRQMLNDRREQREKEIKARSRVIKAPRKTHFFSQGNGLASNSNRPVASLVGVASTNVHSDPVTTGGTNFADGQPSTVFNTNMASQPLPPIGTPAVNADAEKRSSMKSVQTSSISLTTNGPKKHVAGLPFENKNVVVDNVPMSLGSWGHADVNQQVMTLTQTQLDEAMKPVQFERHAVSISEHTGIGLEQGKQSAPVMIQDRSFSSSAYPLNSFLAGEKIQFGAVTATSILSVSRAVTSRIGPPGSGKCRPDISSGHSLSSQENNCAMYFEKEKMPNESGAHLEDPEAEAEAAASAVAVAAISSDEIVGNDLGARARSEAKSFGGADVMVLTSGGVTGSREVNSQSVGEESLSVSLPADLSVETPSLSLWPPVPSPQSSSSPMLSRFPGASPSHFPCFEMNPMLGGPIFSYGPHDESNTQSQPQRNTTPGSAPLGAWPQCHSGVDSFYGPPSGFTGPFITPPGAIPGVQGPPQMVFYNHFTPVGQFGQQVLSFMGTTYIPSGKQPDWKHNPVSTAVGVSEVDINNLNVVPGQRNPPSMPAPIQHLAPGSPLMPMPSPMAMFDISPFQSSGDIPVQARWSHVPAPLLHSVPLSVSLQQHQVEGGLPPQLTHSLPVSSSCGNNRFHEPRSSMPSDSGRHFAVPTDPAARFPEALGLVDTPGAGTACVHSSRPSYISSSGNINNKESNGAGNISMNDSTQSMGSASKPQASQPSTSSAQQYLPPVGYAEQRSTGSSSQKLGMGGEWHRRNIGFQGRNQMLGADKSFSTSKIKQIYVAKPPSTSGAATPG